MLLPDVSLQVGNEAAAALDRSEATEFVAVAIVTLFCATVAGLEAETVSRVDAGVAATELTRVAIWLDAKAATLVGSKVTVLVMTFVELVVAGAAFLLTLVTVLATTVLAKAEAEIAKFTGAPVAFSAVAAAKAAF